MAGIFAGGDMVPSERTVTVAVGHGKKAARNIDAWLRGKTYAPAPKHEIASFDKLNTWYYGEAPKTLQPVLEMARRSSTFEEVVKGLDESNALYEARRCLSCGNCFECDNCYGVCPDNAVIKLGPGKGFEFNFDYCKGCGICAQRMSLRRDPDDPGSDLKQGVIPEEFTASARNVATPRSQGPCRPRRTCRLRRCGPSALPW